MKAIPNLSEKEQKVRSLWLRAFLSLASFNILNLYLTIFQNPSIAWGSFASTAVLILTSFIVFAMYGIQYHFIYRKYGTGWLTFYLFAIPFGCALSFYVFITRGFAPYPPMIFQILSILLPIAFLVPSYCLRRIYRRALLPPSEGN